MATINSLHSLLTCAARLLDRAAEEIQELQLSPTKENIKRIGYVLSEIHDVQGKVYAVCPELMPTHLTQESLNSNADRKLTEAMGNALLRKDAGDHRGAIEVLEDFIAVETSLFHKEIALGEIERLQGRV